ncbi:hypothetical protein Ptr902_04078 [Pyrenophora tritici-repentis]|nr:hypothetical protein Ptr902_04078 [Pyrenophora tritici-repentis]
MSSGFSEQVPASASGDSKDGRSGSSTGDCDTLFSWRPSVTAKKQEEQNRSRYFNMDDDITQASASAFAISPISHSRPRRPKGSYRQSSSTQKIPRDIKPPHTTPHTPSPRTQSFTDTSLCEDGWLEIKGTISAPSSVIEANMSIALRFEMLEVELEKASSEKEREQMVIEAVEVRAKRALERHMSWERSDEMWDLDKGDQ